MAGNAFKITDVVDNRAIQQLQNLTNELNAAKTVYLSLSEDLSKNVGSTPKTFDDLSAKAEKYLASLEKLNKTSEKMANIQIQQVKIMAQVRQSLDGMTSVGKLGSIFEDFTKHVKAASDMLAGLVKSNQQAAQSTQQAAQTMGQASQQMAAAEVNFEQMNNTITSYDSKVLELIRDNLRLRDGINRANESIKSLQKDYKKGAITLGEYRDRVAELIRAKNEFNAQIKQNTSMINAHAKAIASTENSYNQMSAALSELKVAFHNLNEEQRNSPMGQDMIKQAAALDAKLKEIDAKFGVYGRNVGNYSSAFNGLGMSVQQIARELPSLAMGWNTFFLAISNNLPILSDEIARARKEYQQTVAAGGKGVPVWKQVISSIFSWQSLLVVGVTILSLYGKEIIEWIGNLGKAKKALVDTYEATDDFQKKVSESAGSTLSEFEKMSQEWESLGGDIEKQTKFIEENQSAFDKLGLSIISVTDAENVFVNNKDAFIMSIIQRAKAAEVMDIAADEYKKAVKKMLEADELEGEGVTFWDRILSASAKMGAASSNGAVDPFSEELSASSIHKDRIEDLRGESEDYFKSASEMAIKYIQLTEEEKKILEEKGIKITDESTNESKKKLEEYAKYVLDITKSLEESRIKLIKDSREREIAEIISNYDKQFKEIKGKSDEEIALRANLEELKAREIAEVNEKYAKKAREIDIEDMNNRLAAMSADSENEISVRLRLQQKINKALMREEIEAAEKEGKDVQAIRDKWAKKNNELIAQSIEERMGIRERQTDAEIEQVELAAMQEEIALKKRYQRGEISRERYERELTELTLQYSKERLNALIKEAEAELAISGISEERAAQVRRNIEKLKAEIENLNVEKKMKDNADAVDGFNEALGMIESAGNEAMDGLGTVAAGIGKVISDLSDDTKKNWKDVTKDMLNAVSMIMDGLSSVMNSIYDAQIEEIEKAQDANDEAGDREIERIEELEERGAISKEEAEARKRAAEDRTAQKDAELEKKKAELQTKQAKWNKANSIIQTTIATALGIMQAYAQAGPILGSVFAAIIGALGAAQIALIASQPIPKYAKGTKDHPGGLAIVGDGGKREAVITDNGIYATPDKPTLVNLPKHTQVIPDLSYIYSRNGLKSDLDLLDNQRRGSDGLVVNVNNDYKRLEREMSGNKRELTEIKRLMKRSNRISEYNLISNRL